MSLSGVALKIKYKKTIDISHHYFSLESILT